jgi:isoprenylcysteine carboxyl methyltransferase (ICMT) family protein YpbQ
MVYPDENPGESQGGEDAGVRQKVYTVRLHSVCWLHMIREALLSAGLVVGRANVNLILKLFLLLMLAASQGMY